MNAATLQRRPAVLPFLALLAGALAASALLWVYFRVNRSFGDHSLERLRSGHEVRIGYAIEAPYAFLTPDGTVTGESPALARTITGMLGLQKVSWRLCEFGDLTEALEEGRIDVIAAGMFITPERQARLAFSRPTFRVTTGLLVRRGNPLQLTTEADLVTIERIRCAVVSGSVEQARLLGLGIPEHRLQAAPTARAAFGLLAAEVVDAVALSEPTLRWLLAQEPGLAAELIPAPPTLPASYGGFAFRPKDEQLRAAWDAALAEYLGSEAHRRLVEPFGFSERELPGGGGAVP